MPGVIVVHQRLALGDVIGDLLVVAEFSTADDWAERIHYLPLR
jgi:hypothetical protein